MSKWQMIYDKEFERIMGGNATPDEIVELNRDRDENPINEPEEVTELEARWLAKDIADRWDDERRDRGYQMAKEGER